MESPTLSPSIAPPVRACFATTAASSHPRSSRFTMATILKSNATEERKAIHVAMFPWLPFGHVNPFIQLSNHLAFHDGFKVSFLATRDNIPKIQPLLRFPDQIGLVPLDVPPPTQIPTSNVDSENLNPDSPIFKLTQLLIATDSLQAQVETALSQLKPDIIVYEFVHYIPSMAHALGIKAVFYCVTSATAIAYHLVPACSTHQDLTRPPPGFPPTGVTLRAHEAQQLLFAFVAPEEGIPSLHQRVVMAMKEADMIVLKTCGEMESKYCDYISEQYKKPVVMAGPSLNEPQTDTLDERWVKWLDRFPVGSVLYCSFGSDGILSKEELRELLLGLEDSGVPFMAVLKYPKGLTQEEALPEGLEERVKERGLIHSGWVQQELILEHKGVGGYLCHAGFGSVVEAVANECQLVLLPQKGDQFLNARLMSRDLKVGVEVERREEDGWFTRESVSKAVRSVMVDKEGSVGKDVRANHCRLKELLLNKEMKSSYVDQLLQKMRDLVVINKEVKKN
ncbi:cyanidin 3-O-galactoside 2''-O-xylosyltransferase FGGT1-like [Telopea speciosissima]|uniref:cyanidin 3-O-galactoside 2''-O-xylosyltransferase FGGT1-like n=1 Tax=Telopea speciosissima TaxID=54955 RepID=UPI001CC7FA1B|nr:cyanidin 3-O-galactoside 2''-O-xylosyltransferase FGGT1-like [Telopea speciosissima]